MNFAGKQWILLYCVVGISILGLAALRFYERRKLNWLRSLRCPECQASFPVESITSPRQWIETSISGGGTQSGFYLRCEHCRADFRFKDDGTSLGRADVTTNR
jgi:hypothetical protein